MYQTQPGSRGCVQYNLSRVSPWLSALRSAAPCEASRPAVLATRRICCIHTAATQIGAADAGSAALAHDAAAQRRQVLLGAALTCVSGAASVPEAQATKSVHTEKEGDLEAFEFVIHLDVTALKGTVPNQWVEDFKQALGPYGVLLLNQKGQLQDIYKELGAASVVKTNLFGKKRRNIAAADVVTVGDSWIAPAIKAGYLQPLQDAASYRWWDALNPHWRKLVTRNVSGQVDSKGQVWAVPYRWGCNLVAYTPSYLCRRGGVPIRDWADLLQPRLEGRLGFLDSPREFIGVALKTLGLPFNCSHAQLKHSTVSLQQLKARVKQLRQQVRLFSSRDHTRAMIANDVWAIVGSSQDLLPLAIRSSTVSIVAPVSGVSLWADLWAVPKGASGGSEGLGPSPLLPAWFEFGLMPNRVQPTRGLQQGATPLQLPSSDATGREGKGFQEVGAELVKGVMPEEATLLRSEFLLPLDADTTAMYNDLLTL